MQRESAEGRTQRLEIYQSYIESGQTVAAFSRERGTTPWKVKSAIRKSESEAGNGSGFQEVSVPAGGSGEFVVTLRNGRELRVPPYFSEKRVRQLITILETC
jgi:hypothetical protein